MFGTLRYGAEGSQDSRIDLQLKSARATAGSFPNRTACEPCKRKKHRCDSLKPACGRCKAVNGTCTYQSSTSSTERRRKAAHAWRARREIESLKSRMNDPTVDAEKPMTPSSDFQADGDHTTVHRTTPDESTKSLSLSSTILAVSESEQMLVQARAIGLGEDTWSQFMSYPSTPYVPTPPPPSSTSSGTEDDILNNTTHLTSPKCNDTFPIGLTNLDNDTALPSPSWIAGQCTCLVMLLALLDDAFNRLPGIQEESLCEALKYIKQAFEHIEGLFRCSSCMMRSDYSMLLAVVTTSLTDMIGKVAVSLEAPLSSLEKDRDEGNIGSYKLTWGEYEYLSRTLFRYHVEKYCGVVRRMKQTATTTGRGAQILQFQNSERRLLSILEGDNYTSI